jgi:hypothetical protein
LIFLKTEFMSRVIVTAFIVSLFALHSCGKSDTFNGEAGFTGGLWLKMGVFGWVVLIWKEM